MSNTIKIKRGSTTPTTSNIDSYELGFDTTNKILYINNNGTIIPLGNSFVGNFTTAAGTRNTLGLGNTSSALPIANGGTGATSASAARTNLGITLSNLGAAPSTHTHTKSQITDFSHTHLSSEITNWDSLLEKIFPVGAIYISTVDASPAQFFSYATTWTKITDQFLVGAGNTYSSGDTGGAAEVTLSVSQIPSHRHTVYPFSLWYDSSNYDAHLAGGSLYYWDLSSDTRNTTYVGGGGRTRTGLRISLFGCSKETHKQTHKPAFRCLCKGVG